MIELRNLDEARTFLVQGLWLQQLVPPTPEATVPVLRWALEAAAHDQCLPALGFLSDLGHNLLTVQAGARLKEAEAIPGFPPGLLRSYQDYVLGKIIADPSLERAGDSLRRYQGRDQARGLAFVVQQFRQRSGFPAVSLNPAVLKTLMREPPGQVLKSGWDSLLREGIMPELVAGYEGLVRAARQTAEFLGPEDIFELEHGTALAKFGQRVALRQVLQAADLFEKSLPLLQPRPLSARREVPTRVLDEDTYPVGGFSALSTRGTIESLLQSQLAYMEKSERPDLFDMKYLRDELLYYSRDENTFFRRRKTFVFLLYPDLVNARFKDADLAWQRIILLLALLVVVVRKLCEWLREDALRFEVLFLEPPNSEPALADEKNLLQTLLREQIANGTVNVDATPSRHAAARWCELNARRSLCCCLTVGMDPRPLVVADTDVMRLNLSRPNPELPDEEPTEPADSTDPLANWRLVLETLLRRWV